MEYRELARCADLNREAFDEALPSYVAAKLAQVTPALEAGERRVWLDATDCVWCVFDDPRFRRSGDEARELRKACPREFDLCLYWSFGDIVMPAGCDERWVAVRIVEEALGQVRASGLAGRRGTRDVSGVAHEGLHIGRRLLGGMGRLGRRLS